MFTEVYDLEQGTLLGPDLHHNITHNRLTPNFYQVLETVPRILWGLLGPHFTLWDRPSNTYVIIYNHTSHRMYDIIDAQVGHAACPAVLGPMIKNTILSEVICVGPCFQFLA
jgi:hypothetical protein